MSDTPRSSTPGGTPEQARRDAESVSQRMDRERTEARDASERASDRIRREADDFAGEARRRAQEGAEAGKESIASSLDDFAAAIRKASDELGERDQSLGASAVRQAATGLEDASRSLHGRSPEEIVRSVTSFARQNPTAFLVGAALAGLALGRFARASRDHDDEAAFEEAAPHYEPRRSSSAAPARATGPSPIGSNPAGRSGLGGNS